MYLSAIADAFITDLQNKHGSSAQLNLQSKIETVETQYAFIAFEKVINRKKNEFRDIDSMQNIDKLN